VQTLSTLQRLKHPHILRLVGCYTFNSKHNLISPYVADGTLKKYLEKPKPADFCKEELFYSISGLASAIWALHEFVLEDTAPSLKGQHQDLRPDNILVDGNRFILADFGLSSIKSIQEDSRTPFKGRKGYCQAPECADLRHPYREYKTTRKTDIFALACIIADLLVYLVKGTSGVGAFLDDRKFKESPMCYSLYHKGDSANNAVAAWLENLVSENQSQSLRDMVDLVMKMLDILPKNRPEAAIVTARLYMNTIMAFSEQFRVLFNQFTPSPDALIERARFSSWAMSQDVELYSSSSDATTTGKFWDSTVDILRQMKKALESIDKTTPDLDCRSFIEVRTLNTQLLNTLSSERRSSAQSRLESIILANIRPEEQGETYTTIRDALGDSYLNRRAETQHLVAQVEDATAPFPTPIFQLLGGPVRYVQTIGRYHVAKLRDKKDNHNKSVIVEIIQYQDQLRRQRLLPRIHALCKLLSSEQLGQELRIPKFYGLHDNTQAFCFEIIYEFPGEHQAENLQLMPISLRELLTEREQCHYPSWDTRLGLGLELAESLAAFHDVTWFHKDLTSFNVLFFPTSQTAPTARATHPYLLGFQHSRSAADDFTEGPLQDRSHQRYHHPRYISLETRHFTRFRPQFDWYSLGILLIEIGLWETIDRFMHEHAQKDNYAFSENLIQYKLSALSFNMGDKYVDIVKECLTGLNEKPENTDEREQLDLATNLMLKDKVVIPLKSLDRTRSTQGVDKKRKRGFEGQIIPRPAQRRKPL
jgi:serine/threonine protein kinase